MKNKIQNIIVWATIATFWLILLTGALDSTFDTATPAGTDNPRDADDRMREIKDAVQERMNDHNSEEDEGDHYWPLTGTEVSDTDAGQHRMVTLRELGSDPDGLTSYGTISNIGFLYTKDDSGATELYWEDDSSNVIQLTAGGYIEGESIKDDTIDGDSVRLDNEEWFTSENAAQNGNVNLIKANSSDVLILSDGAQIEAGNTVDDDQDIADKEYVDSVVGSANWTPTSYAAEESVTCPNGLIIKMGYKVGEGAVTFGTAFPTAIVSVTATRVGTQHEHGTTSVHTVTTTGFTIDQYNLGTGTYWIAIGY
jgi:hypothetical protein